VRVNGPLRVVAEITPAALQELRIVPGARVWTAVKATEVRVQPT
jgi:molybdate transport system ATP-binding protein